MRVFKGFAIKIATHAVEKTLEHSLELFINKVVVCPKINNCSVLNAAD